MKKPSIIIILILSLLFCAPGIEAQRRARPGSMKHTNAEVVEKQKVTKLNCKYIHDGSTFNGEVFMVGEGAMLPIGKAKIVFRGGRYAFSFENAEFKVNKFAAMNQDERLKKGISKYRYDNSYESKKLGQDFDYSGKYATIEQYGEKWLILYCGNSDDIYAKIPLNSVNDSSFEYTDDGMMIRMSCKN